MAMDTAITESLTEMKTSLLQDLQMIRNMRTTLVKAQQFDRVTALKEIEERINLLTEAVDAATK